MIDRNCIAGKPSNEEEAIIDTDLTSIAEGDSSISMAVVVCILIVIIVIIIIIIIVTARRGWCCYSKNIKKSRVHILPLDKGYGG